MTIILKELLTVWLYSIVIMCLKLLVIYKVLSLLLNIQVLWSVTAIEHAVPNISQALHSINIFELFYINFTCDTEKHKDVCMIDTTIFPTIRHVPK